MSFAAVPKPRVRSPLRMRLGGAYFRLRRYAQWYLSGTRWARRRVALATAPEVLFSHRTPLLRPLKDVDMWLQANKVTNLRLAVARLNGICLQPGEMLSYWRLIGKPSARRGFVPGMVLHNGKIQTDVGGGLCQLSNLIYWMTLHTPLTVVERWRHNYDVFPDSGRQQPFASGATCSYNYVDLQIRNDTQQPFLLHLYLTDTDLVGEWRSDHALPLRYQVYEARHEIRPEFWGGYTRHNELRRQVFDPHGVQVDDQFVTENHAIMMYEPLLGTGGA